MEQFKKYLLKNDALHSLHLLELEHYNAKLKDVGCCYGYTDNVRIGGGPRTDTLGGELITSVGNTYLKKWRSVFTNNTLWAKPIN